MVTVVQVPGTHSTCTHTYTTFMSCNGTVIEKGNLVMEKYGDTQVFNNQQITCTHYCTCTEPVFFVR